LNVEEFGSITGVGLSSEDSELLTPDYVSLYAGGQAAGGTGFCKDVSATLFLLVICLHSSDDLVLKRIEYEWNDFISIVDIMDEEPGGSPEIEIVFGTEFVEVAFSLLYGGSV